jgi:hypothetical protein
VTEAPAEGDAKGHRKREGREEGPKRQGEAGGCRSAFKGVSLTRSAGGWAGCRRRSEWNITGVQTLHKSAVDAESTRASYFFVRQVPQWANRDFNMDCGAGI